MSGRALVGYVAAFLAGAAVLYGVLLAGSPWPPVGAAPQYEYTSVQVFPGGDDDLRRRLEAGWEVERTSQERSSGGAALTTYVLRRRRP